VKVQHDAPIRFSVKISKVDQETREVEGIATQEVLDAHNQVVDHAAMKSVLADWPGNIREMHQPKAVGRAIFAKTDDDQRATILRARVSRGAPDTWEKVLDGTLSAFSIGGVGKVVMEKGVDGHEVGRIFMQKLTEISLVDNPACPTAQFGIVKLAENGELVGMQPAEPEPKTAVLGSDLVVKLGMLAAALPKIAKRAEPYDVQQALQCIAFLESLVANEMFEAEYADVFGETDNAATQQAEIAYLRAAAGFLLKFLVSEFESQFATSDLSTEVSMAKRRESFTAALDTFQKAIPATWSQLDGTGTLWLAKAGARHSKKDVEMIQNMHDTSMALGASCKVADAADDDDVANAQNTTAATPVAVEQAASTAAAASATPASPVVAPRVEAGTASEPPAAAVVEKVDTPATATAPVTASTDVAGTVDITKLIASEVQKAMEAQKVTHDGEVAELRKQMKALEDAPMPGGPKTRATGDEPTGTPAEKRFGNDPLVSSETQADPAEVDALLAKMIADTTDEHQRTLLVERRITHQRKHGLGQLAVRRETGVPRAR
jgi:hypothetical protein